MCFLAKHSLLAHFAFLVCGDRGTVDYYSPVDTPRLGTQIASKIERLALHFYRFSQYLANFLLFPSISETERQKRRVAD